MKIQTFHLALVKFLNNYPLAIKEMNERADALTKTGAEQALVAPEPA